MLILRSFTPNFRRGVATAGERRRLDAAGVTDRFAQDYLAWRLGTMRLACVCLAATLAYDTWSHFGRSHDDPIYSPTGRLIQFGMPAMTASLCLGALLIALHLWKRPRQSWWPLLIGIGVYFATPFLIAACPTSWLVRDGADNPFFTLQLAIHENRPPPNLPAVAASLLTSVFLVLPTFSLLAGAFRAARLVKSAVPESFAAGLLMVLLIPINLCAIVTAFMLLLSLDQDWLLLGATLGISLAQLIYLTRARDLCTPLSPDEHARRMGWLEPLRTALLAAAGILFALFVLTATYLGRPLVGREHALLSPWFPFHRVARDALHFAVNYLLVLLLLTDFTIRKLRSLGIGAAGADGRETPSHDERLADQPRVRLIPLD